MEKLVYILHIYKMKEINKKTEKWCLCAPERRKNLLKADACP